MKWLCTLVVGNGGKIFLTKYTLIELPSLERSTNGGYVRFVEEHGQVYWNFDSIRTMELRPVKP